MSQNEQVILKYGTTAGYWEKILGTLSDVRTDANVIKLIRNDLGVFSISFFNFKIIFLFSLFLFLCPHSQSFFK